MDKSLVCLCALDFLINLNGLLMAPFYPTVAEHRGISPVLVGLVFSAMPGSGFVLSLVLPTVLQRISKRGAMLLGCMLQTLAMLLMAVSFYLPRYEFFAVGLISRIFSGISLGLVQTSAYSLVVSTYPRQTKEVFSALGMCAGVSVMLGPVVSAPLYAALGFTAIFYAASGVFLLSSALVYFVKEEKVVSSAESGKVGLLGLLSKPAIGICPAAMMYIVICGGVMETYVSSHLLKLGLPMYAVGLAIGCTPGGYTLACVLFSGIAQKVSLKRVVSLGLVGGTIDTLLLGPPPVIFPASYWVVTLGILMLGISLALVFVPCIPHLLSTALQLGYISNQSLSDSLGSITAGAFSLGETLGPVLGGALLSGLSFVWTAVVLAAAGPGVLLCYLLLAMKEEKTEVRKSLLGEEMKLQEASDDLGTSKEP